MKYEKITNKLNFFSSEKLRIDFFNVAKFYFSSTTTGGTKSSKETLWRRKWIDPATLKYRYVNVNLSCWPSHLIDMIMGMPA
jgi:hypothetical protein